jgi:hypothetical protein
MRLNTLALAVAAIAANIAVSASATPADLVGIVGVRGSSLENVMDERGYTFAKAQGPQYWWNAQTHTCAAISISQGRVSRVNDASPAQCGKQEAHHGDGAAAVRGCQDAFGGNGRLNSVTALRPGFWEVILTDNYGRKVACTGKSDGMVEEWAELGRQ